MLPKAVEYSTPSRTLRASIQLSWIGGARIGGLGGRVRLHSRTRGGTRPDPGEKIDRAASTGRSARPRCDLRRCGREASATSPAGASRRRPQRVPPLFGDTRGRLVPQRCCRCRAGDQSSRSPEPDCKQVTERVLPRPPPRPSDLELLHHPPAREGRSGAAFVGSAASEKQRISRLHSPALWLPSQA